MVYVDGQPRLVVEREEGQALTSGPIDPTQPANSQAATVLGQTPTGKPIIRLSPQIRAERLDRAIPPIPADTIEQFAVKPRVLTQEQIDESPYIVGNLDERLISASGNQVYARGTGMDKEGGDALHSIFRPSKALTDPDTQEVLGYEVAYVGDALVRFFGDPATLLITSSNRETLTGDILRPIKGNKIFHDYIPRAANLDADGRVISLFNAINNAAQNQVIVINRGEREGLERGDVLGIDEFGEEVRDTITPEISDTVKLPDTRIGLAIIFQVFERVSYALILESTRVVQVGDIVGPP